MLTPILSFSLKLYNIDKLSMAKAAYNAIKIAPLDEEVICHDRRSRELHHLALLQDRCQSELNLKLYFPTLLLLKIKNQQEICLAVVLGWRHLIPSGGVLYKFIRGKMIYSTANNVSIRQ